MKKINTKSEKETFEFAKNFTKKLKGGEVLALDGDLGSGKTVFASGLAAGLNIKGRVNSPTFNIMKLYQIKNHKFKIRNLVHVDAYRLKSHKDLKEIGLDEYLGRKDSIVIIEWAEKAGKILPKNTIYITIKHESKNKRIIKYGLKNV